MDCYGGNAFSLALCGDPDVWLQRCSERPAGWTGDVLQMCPIAGTEADYCQDHQTQARHGSTFSVLSWFLWFLCSLKVCLHFPAVHISDQRAKDVLNMFPDLLLPFPHTPSPLVRLNLCRPTKAHQIENSIYSDLERACRWEKKPLGIFKKSLTHVLFTFF